MTFHVERIDHVVLRVPGSGDLDLLDAQQIVGAEDPRATLLWIDPETDLVTLRYTLDAAQDVRGLYERYRRAGVALGAFTPFALRLQRPDRQEFVDGLNVELPPGLLAKVKDVPLCTDAQAAAGACPAASRIGTVTVGAGLGTHPFFVNGSMSLTEGYKGAPYGLVIAVRAVAGPFDLGTVVVRQAVFVTTQWSVVLTAGRRDTTRASTWPYGWKKQPILLARCNASCAASSPE